MVANSYRRIKLGAWPTVLSRPVVSHRSVSMGCQGSAVTERGAVRAVHESQADLIMLVFRAYG